MSQFLTFIFHFQFTIILGHVTYCFGTLLKDHPNSGLTFDVQKCAENNHQINAHLQNLPKSADILYLRRFILHPKHKHNSSNTQFQRLK